MPKIISPAMRAHLDEETTRLAAIWRITRKDGAQFFFTDHDRDIVFGGEVYRADAGFARAAIRSDAGFAVDNLDLVGVFAEGGIVEDEVRAGLFARPEHARGVQPQLPGRPGRPSLQIPDRAARAGSGSGGERGRVLPGSYCEREDQRYRSPTRRICLRSASSSQDCRTGPKLGQLIHTALASENA
jgi:hypothetical protein